MPRKHSIRALPSIQSLYEKLEQSYLEWKRYHPAALLRDGLDFNGARAIRSDPAGVKLHKDTTTAFDEFDQAICKLITRDKTALGDSRILERIRQAQWFGDKKFFDDLGYAVRANVGLDTRVSKRAGVMIVRMCAEDYLIDGNESSIEEAYNYWKDIDIEKRRKEQPDADLLISRWQKIKEEITGESESGGEGGDLRSFRDRVKTLAQEIQKRAIPIPKRHQP